MLTAIPQDAMEEGIKAWTEGARRTATRPQDDQEEEDTVVARRDRNAGTGESRDGPTPQASDQAAGVRHARDLSAKPPNSLYPEGEGGEGG